MGRRGRRGSWTFLSNHFMVLLLIAQDPDIRIAEVADRIGITERAVQALVADLVDGGHLKRTKLGRRNHYEIDLAMPMRHMETQHQQLGELLALLARTKQSPTPSS